MIRSYAPPDARRGGSQKTLRADVAIVNRRGLHARAAAKFVKVAEQFVADIEVAKDDMVTQHRLLRDFFMPYLKIRNKGHGYAVSIVKAGAKLVGHDAGPVRAPLTDLKPDEMDELAALIRKLGPQ